MHDIMCVEKRVKNVKFVFFSRCVWKKFVIAVSSPAVKCLKLAEM